MRVPTVLFCAVLLFGCPNGNGDGARIAKAMIGQTGGTVTSPDGKLTLDIPPGALPQDTEITIRPVALAEITQEMRDLGVEVAYEFGPDGLQFQAPVTVRVALDSPAPQDVPLMIPLSVSGSVLEELDGVLSIDLADRGATLVATMSHFTILNLAHGFGTRPVGPVLIQITTDPPGVLTGEKPCVEGEFTVTYTICVDEPLQAKLRYLLLDSSTSHLDVDLSFQNNDDTLVLPRGWTGKVTHTVTYRCGESGLARFEGGIHLEEDGVVHLIADTFGELKAWSLTFFRDGVECKEPEPPEVDLILMDLGIPGELSADRAEGLVFDNLVGPAMDALGGARLPENVEIFTVAGDKEFAVVAADVSTDDWTVFVERFTPIDDGVVATSVEFWFEDLPFGDPRTNLAIGSRDGVSRLFNITQYSRNFRAGDYPEVVAFNEHQNLAQIGYSSEIVSFLVEPFNAAPDIRSSDYVDTSVWGPFARGTGGGDGTLFLSTDPPGPGGTGQVWHFLDIFDPNGEAHEVGAAGEDVIDMDAVLLAENRYAIGTANFASNDFTLFTQIDGSAGPKATISVGLQPTAVCATEYSDRIVWTAPCMGDDTIWFIQQDKQTYDVIEVVETAAPAGLSGLTDCFTGGSSETESEVLFRVTAVGNGKAGTYEVRLSK